jgi:hypothetical protein
MTLPPPIENKCIGTMFEDIPRFSRDGKRRLKSQYTIEYIELAGKRFYYAWASGDLDTLYNAAIRDHPGREWVIWPRGGWGGTTMPAIYIRNPDREIELEAEARKALAARTG